MGSVVRRGRAVEVRAQADGFESAVNSALATRVIQEIRLGGIGDRKQQVWDHIQRLTKDTRIPLEQLPQFALRFCLSNPAVSTVIPGMRSPAHVASNASVSEMGPLPGDLLRKVQSHRWLRNYYD